jgi:hypothetical protein
MKEVLVNLPLVEQQSNPQAIQQYIITILLELNGETERHNNSHDGSPDKLERENMRREILVVMNRSIPLTTVHDVQQMAFAMHLITVSVQSPSQKL